MRQHNAYKWPFWVHIIDHISKMGNVNSLKYSGNQDLTMPFLITLIKCSFMYHRYNMKKIKSAPILCFRRYHTGQCKSTGGCYNELVVAYFGTGGGVKWWKR